MKKVEVLVRDRNTLVLNESAEKGDLIDLTSLNELDNTAILDEYLKKFKEEPPFIIEFPYENKQYGIIMEWAIYKNEKLTFKKVSELMHKLNIETGVVFNNKKENEEENKKDMVDSKKIRALLKKYGASDYEIENFMDELEEDFNPYI